MHPVELYIARLVGKRVSKVNVGPAGFSFQFPFDNPDQQDTGKSGYSLWARCPAFLRRDSGGETIDRWVDFEEIENLPDLVTGVTIVSFKLDPDGCTLELVTEGVVFKLVPSVQELDMPWSIFDYNANKDYSFSVYSDYFEGYWAV